MRTHGFIPNMHHEGRYPSTPSQLGPRPAILEWRLGRQVPGSQITDTTENTARIRTSRVSLVLGLEIFKRALPGNPRQAQASESALRVIFMVLHTWFNFTKKAVTDVNLPGARERGVLHHSDRGCLCRLHVSHLLNDHQWCHTLILHKTIQLYT